jgi:hypothetical protein
MKRIILLTTIGAVVAVMVLLAAGGSAMAIERTVPAAACHGTDTAHEDAVPEGEESPGSAGQHTETAHANIPHCIRS